MKILDLVGKASVLILIAIMAVVFFLIPGFGSTIIYDTLNMDIKDHSGMARVGLFVVHAAILISIYYYVGVNYG